MRWYTNNTCLKTEAHDNYSFGKIERKSRKTDGFMAFVAAVCVSGELEDCGEEIDISDLEVGVYSY